MSFPLKHLLDLEARTVTMSSCGEALLQAFDQACPDDSSLPSVARLGGGWDRWTVVFRSGHETPVLAGVGTLGPMARLALFRLPGVEQPANGPDG